MAESLEELIAQAVATVPTVSPTEAYQRLQQDSDVILLDVRELSHSNNVDKISGALFVSLGSLTYRAGRDVPNEWREPLLQDRLRPIITVCLHGPMGALAGKLLTDMGFADVCVLAGGIRAWKDAGFPLE
jgi:rhodanese-related sulfurtransferase